MRRYTPFLLLVVLLVAQPAAAEDEKNDAKTQSNRVKCTLEYSLKGWSAFYKTSKGEGTVTCDNGETAEVSIRIKGGGLTFGKSEIVDGKGSFTPVVSIDQIMGTYGQGTAHAGAAKSVQAAVITKGEISLTLTGKGTGFDVGVDFGKFVIERK